VEVERVKGWLIAAAALSCAAAVSAAGIIGFIGLIAPHLARLLLGPHHRTLIPAASLFGALLLLWCDTLARLLVRPAELPVGISRRSSASLFPLALAPSAAGVRVTETAAPTPQRKRPTVRPRAP